MKLVITVIAKKTEGPTPTFGALQQALEEELDGTEIWGQNENSDKEWAVELTVEKVERG